MTPPARDDRSAEEAAALELVRLARARGFDLTGPGGLLKQVTDAVMEDQLDGELAEHLETTAGAAPSNWRGRSRTKSVQTSAAGVVTIRVPRDWAGTFTPRSISCWQRRPGGMTEAVLSLSARGLTHGEISAFR